jgi:hypothetical protein
MSDPHPADVYVVFAEKLKADLDAFLKNNSPVGAGIDSHHRTRIHAVLTAIGILAEDLIRECNRSTSKPPPNPQRM